MKQIADSREQRAGNVLRLARRHVCCLHVVRAKHEQRGSNLLETLLAIGLVAAMTPFVYNRIAETSREISDVSAAKQVYSWKELMSGYVRQNQADWPPDAEVELDEAEMNIIRAPNPGAAAQLYPFVSFLEKYRHGGGTTIDSYIAFPAKFDPLRMRKIAKTLGADAAVVDADGVAYSSLGGWSIESELFAENDLIYRVTVMLAKDDSALYLHRMKSDDDSLNTMERDLSMSMHNILDADIVNAGTLDSKMAAAWFVNSDTFNADDAAFPDGASLDPTNAKFGSIRVTGDVIGFRNIAAQTFTGTGGAANWSAQGNIVADRASVTGAVNVGRNLNMKSSTSKTISGFVGVSAYSLAAPYVSADDLRFAEGFGLSVSNELSLSYSNVPLRLGNWSFPSTTAPKFSGLTLRMTTAPTVASAPKGFKSILGSGWKGTKSSIADNSEQGTDGSAQ